MKFVTEKSVWIKRPWLMAGILSGILFLLRLLFVTFGPLDLAPDEAQYWDWSRHLAWSYATKPPLTAWLLALSTSIFGHTFIGVRFFALLGQAALPLLGMAMARRLTPFHQKNSAGWWAFALLTTAPLVTAGGLMMSPDVPSLTLWLLALWQLTGIDFQSISPQWRRWLLLGLTVGLAGLAKPTVALFFPLLGLYLLWQHRAVLWRPQVYVAGLVALACQAPVFYWNATHHWAMFAHVLDQTDSDPRHGGLGSVLEFVGGQAAMVGPVSLLALLVALAVAWRTRQRLLWLFTTLPFVFFLLNSWHAKVQANWPILGMTTGLVLLAVLLPAAPRWGKRLLGAGLALNLLLAATVHDTFLLRDLGLHLPIKNDPTKPLLGWRGLGEDLGELLTVYPDAYVLTTRYQTTAGLAFHTPQQPAVLYKNPGWRRENNYDFMPWPDLTGQAVLYVNEGNFLRPEVAGWFRHCFHVGNLRAERKGLTLRTATAYLCEGYQE